MFLLTPLLLSLAQAAEPEIDFSGRIQTDLRFRVTDVDQGPWYAPAPHEGSQRA